MNDFKKIAINFIGEDFFHNEWKKFKEIRKKEVNMISSQEGLLYEIRMHPLLRVIFNSQNLNNERIDFNLIFPQGMADNMLSYLGRDLHLLESEIKKRGREIKKNLIESSKYETTAFTLLIASAFKLLGHSIELIPSDPNKLTKKPADIAVITKSGKKITVECKRRDQRKSDDNIYEFLIRLSHRIRDLVKLLNIRDIIVTIELNKNDFNQKGFVDRFIDEMSKRFFRRIFSNYIIQQTQVKFSTLSSYPQIKDLLLKSGQFNKGGLLYTRAEDSIFCSDKDIPIVFFVNKLIEIDKIPSSISEEIIDSANKTSIENPLITYYDIGEGFDEWIDKIIKRVADAFKNKDEDIVKLDGIFLSKTIIRNNFGNLYVQPKITGVFRYSKIKDIVKNKDMFPGQDGETGIDTYLKLMP
ncbi:MAG: hypothetical protein WC894_05105 [Patescibacteria group bacterium]